MDNMSIIVVGSLGHVKIDVGEGNEQGTGNLVNVYSVMEAQQQLIGTLQEQVDKLKKENGRLVKQTGQQGRLIKKQNRMIGDLNREIEKLKSDQARGEDFGGDGKPAMEENALGNRKRMIPGPTQGTTKLLKVGGGKGCGDLADGSTKTEVNLMSEPEGLHLNNEDKKGSLAFPGFSLSKMPVDKVHEVVDQGLETEAISSQGHDHVKIWNEFSSSYHGNFRFGAHSGIPDQTVATTKPSGDKPVPVPLKTVITKHDASKEMNHEIVIKEKLKNTKGLKGYFKCVCGREFKSLGGANRHVRSFTHEEIFKCTKCSSTFAWSFNLTRHYRKVHKFTECTTTKFTCMECGLTGIETMEMLWKHRKEVHSECKLP